ncbi:MAG: hypothetical protein JW938_06700 [Candidatus Omnitrophica bacterium]|nr:hypothetical protein [Candidatus Omnitrophota bacterium]
MKIRSISMVTIVVFMLSTCVPATASYGFDPYATLAIHTLSTKQNGDNDADDLLKESIEGAGKTARQLDEEKYIKRYTDRSQFGVSYNRTMTQVAIDDQMAEYNKDYRTIKSTIELGNRRVLFHDAKEMVKKFLEEYAGKKFGPVDPDFFSAEFIRSHNTSTFGITKGWKPNRTVLYIEESLLTKEVDIHPEERTHALARAMVYTLNGGTHEENKVAEFEFARRYCPEAVRNLPFDVVKVYENLVETQVPQEGDEHYDPTMTALIKKRMKESLWEIGINFLNGEANGLGFCAIKADPLHYGHIDSMLRMMAQHKLEGLALQLQGFDDRKPNNDGQVTFPFRFAQAEWLMSESSEMFSYFGPEGGSFKDGEADFPDFIREKMDEGYTKFVYYAGGDHAHFYASGKYNEEKGRIVPRTYEDGETIYPDVIEKMRFIRETDPIVRVYDNGDRVEIENTNVMEAFKNGKIDIQATFSIRDPNEIIPLDEEKVLLEKAIAEGWVSYLRELNLPDTSSTVLRNVFSGKPGKLSFVPKYITKYVFGNDAYRGMMIKLPEAIRHIAHDEVISNADVELLMAWIIQAEENGTDVSAENIYTMLKDVKGYSDERFKGTTLSMVEVERCFNRIEELDKKNAQAAANRIVPINEVQKIVDGLENSRVHEFTDESSIQKQLNVARDILLRASVDRKKKALSGFEDELARLLTTLAPYEKYNAYEAEHSDYAKRTTLYENTVVADRLFNLNKEYNGLKVDQEDVNTFNLLMVAKSIIARAYADLIVDNQEHVARIAEVVFPKIRAYAVKKMGETEGDNQTKLAKTMVLEFLRDKNMPRYVRQGIVRGMLEDRHDDILFAFGKGWREFGTAGIRNKGPESKFDEIQLLELEEFARKLTPPILQGPNTMNIVTLLQQTATVKHIMNELQKFVNDPANKNKLSVNVRELIEKSDLYKKALARRDGDPSKLPALPDKKITIRLTDEIKQAIRNKQVTFAYDSRLNAGEIAHVLGADLISNEGTTVQIFDNVAGMPALTYAAKHQGSLFGFLISASHSEPNFLGFKFVVGPLMSQVDTPFQQMIMGFRNLIDYEDINLAFADTKFDRKAQNALLEQHNDDLEWLSGETPRQEVGKFSYCGVDKAKIIDFYTGYYEHLKKRSILYGLELPEDEIADLKKNYELLYTAFSGAGADNAGNFKGFMQKMGYENIETIKRHTAEVNGRFPAFINEWSVGMPDPGSLEACIINFVDYFRQPDQAGEDLENIDAAVDSFNRKNCIIATDPDIDRASMTIKLPKGIPGNVKSNLIDVLTKYMEYKGFSSHKKAVILSKLQDKLEDKLHLTANDAWAFMAFNQLLPVLQEQEKLPKDERGDKLYVIIKSHVTTPALEDIAGKFREQGHHVYTVNTFVGFTLLAERAEQFFNMSRDAWTLKQMIEHGVDDRIIKLALEIMERTYAPIEGEIQAIDDMMEDLRSAIRKGISTIDASGKQTLLAALSLVAHLEIVCGVEESNGYGEFGKTEVHNIDAGIVGDIIKDAAAIKSVDQVEQLINEIANSYVVVPASEGRTAITAKVFDIIDEHIREKDGALAAYKFVELAILLMQRAPQNKEDALYDAYLNMWKSLGIVTSTETLWTRYPGADGADQKVKAIERIEKILSYAIVKMLGDTSRPTTLFGGKYSFDTDVAMPIEIYWGDKYDSNFKRFPEEGIKLYLQRKYNDVTYKIQVVIRPSGTGMENKDYNFSRAHIPAGKSVQEVIEDTAVVTREIGEDFFGISPRDSDYDQETYVAVFEQGQLAGLLQTMKANGDENAIKIFAILMGLDKLPLTDLENEVIDHAIKFARTVKKPKGASVDMGKYNEEKRIAQEKNREMMTTFIASEEVKNYKGKMVSFLVNGQEILAIPEAAAIALNAAVADYIVSLIEKRDDLQTVSCEVKDLAIMVSNELGDKEIKVKKYRKPEAADAVDETETTTEYLIRA